MRSWHPLRNVDRDKVLSCWTLSVSFIQISFPAGEMNLYWCSSLFVFLSVCFSHKSINEQQLVCFLPINDFSVYSAADKVLPDRKLFPFFLNIIKMILCLLFLNCIPLVFSRFEKGNSHPIKYILLLCSISVSSCCFDVIIIWSWSVSSSQPYRVWCTQADTNMKSHPQTCSDAHTRRNITAIHASVTSK